MQNANTSLSPQKLAPAPNPQGRTPVADGLYVGGMVPFSTVDFPGHLAAVIFCQGCPWKCRYCHNGHLRPFGEGQLMWQDVRSFLKKRVGWLEAVVFSGGEATAHASLPAAMQEARDMGYQIGLHTGGAYPLRLAEVLPLVDWIGLDVKAPYDARYDRITGRKDSAIDAYRSLQLVLASGKDYQLRTTVHPKLTTDQDIADINATLQNLGAGPTVIQEFRPKGCGDFALCQT